MKKNLLLIFTFLLIFVSGFSQTAKIDSPLVANQELLAESQHPRVSQIINALLNKNHYQKQEINDNFSEKVFDKFLSELDYNKSYFLASDIVSFSIHKDKFDDYLIAGNVNAAFDIFNTYKKRMNDQIEFSLNSLKKEFDFTKDDYFEPNRDKSDWFKSKTDQNEWWYKRVKNEALSLKLAGKDWASISETLTKRYQNLQKQVNQFKSEDVFQTYMNSFTECFDPHTSYFSPRSSEDFKINMSLSLEGIGAQLRTENEYTKVAEIIVGGPADRSKLLFANDKIVAVGQGTDGKLVDVVGWRIDDVVSLIRGPKNTIVRLEIIPSTAGPTDPHKVIEILRDKVKLEEQAAKSETKTIENGGKTFKIGVIDLPTFYIDFDAYNRGDADYKSTTRDVKKLIEKLKSEKVDGILIDLRNNGGGSLKEAIELTGLFIPEGPVVQVRDSQGKIDVDEDTDPSVSWDGPMAVVVNRFSASASEIFAGAIQDYGRGLIVGEQTYGKGTVQNLIDLDRFFPQGSTDKSSSTSKYGQLKLTLAKFYRIDGSSTQNVGVMPDIDYPSALTASEYGESSQPTALAWDKIAPTKYKSENIISKVKQQVQVSHDVRASKNVDFKALVEEISEYKKEREKKLISLNEEKRKKERDDAEKRKNDRENAKRKAKGLPPLEKGKPKPAGEKEDDVLLTESEFVLSDFIVASKKFSNTKLGQNDKKVD